MKEFDPHIKKCLEKGLIHIGFRCEIIHTWMTTPFQEQLLLFTSNRGVEHAMLLLIGKVLDPDFCTLAERKYPYPQGVGKKTQFGHLISGSYVRIYLLGDVITIEQEQTEIPEPYSSPGVYMTPGVYCRKGVGYTFSDAVQNMASSKHFIKETCVPNDPFR